MKESSSAAEQKATLQPYLSPLAVWALSVGSAIGWGSLVVTGKTYLSQAEPMGSVLGLLIGFVMMLLVANHYLFLANRYPGTGGLYNYVKYIFGYDRAFLVGWFMFLTYIAIFWANATSIPLFARYFLHDVFKVGYLYTLFGFEVYLGEALVTLAVIAAVALLCAKSKKLTAHCMEVLALVFTVGITVCFAAAMLGRRGAEMTMEPAFIPNAGRMRQVIRIAFISPWAFIVTMGMTLAERVNESRESAVMDDIQRYVDGTADSDTLAMEEEEFFAEQRLRLHDADNISVLVIFGLFSLSLGVMLVNYFSMKKWEMRTSAERDQAREAVNRDPLTGVKSKHAFGIQEGVMEKKIADGEAGKFGVIVCDVNGLKKINDTLGHKAGDEYIRSACKMLCEYFQHSPVFRIGGDEFAVLLFGRDYEARHDILRAINEKIEENLGSGKPVASLGLAEYAQGKDTSFHEVFKRADGLVYERKTQLKSMGAVTRD